jgi:hypothetical protein
VFSTVGFVRIVTESISDLIYHYNVGAPFERIAVDIAGPFRESDRRNRYLLIAMDYFTKWPKV